MSRWSPQVLPEVARQPEPLAIGDVLAGIGDGMTKRRERQRRDRLDAEQRARTKVLDDRDATDRAARLQRDYVLDRQRAEDNGYVPVPRRDPVAFKPVDVTGGAAGMQERTIADMLAEASNPTEASRPQRQRMTLRRPDGTDEEFEFDEEQTREARQARAQAARDAARPVAPVRDPVADARAIYESKQEYDRQHRIGDFDPRKYRGGGSGGDGAMTDVQRVNIADKLLDDANGEVARVESRRPKAPVFDEWRGMERPLPQDKAYGAFKTDSLATAGRYTADSTAWAGRADAAHRNAAKWSSIADALASNVLGLKGGEAVRGSNYVAAQREIADMTTQMNEALAKVGNDAAKREQLRRRVAEAVASINAKYGIRPQQE